MKQTLKPDGSITQKPENDEILRLSKEFKKTTSEIRRIVEKTSMNFNPLENWK